LITKEMVMSTLREPAVAGQFYPASSARLRTDVTDLLAQAEPVVPSHVQALIVPHAGYVYSGLTAAKAFAVARQGKYCRALVIAPSHRTAFSGLAAADFTAYRTPLGEMPVDLQAQADVMSAAGSAAHLIPRAHLGEHALEVELPFLQVLFPALPIMPFICGQLDDANLATLARALAPLWTPETLWVISSDFTHYGAQFGYLPFVAEVKENLSALDRGAIDRILALDEPGLSAYLAETGATICGANPIRLLLAVAAARAAAADPVEPRLVDYTTSGELTDDWSHCVSYASIAFSR
jgi:AmmeMemoRadiSam system protein B